MCVTEFNCVKFVADLMQTLPHILGKLCNEFSATLNSNIATNLVQQLSANFSRNVVQILQKINGNCPVGTTFSALFVT